MYTVNATHAPITIHFQSNREPRGLAPLRPRTSVVVVVVVMVPLVLMFVVVLMVMVVVMLMRVRNPRVLAEDQRLDRHGHGERRHPEAPEIDVVEVPQRDAVEREHLRRDAQLLLQQRADRLRDVAVENDEERLGPGNRYRQRLRDAARP